MEVKGETIALANDGYDNATFLMKKGDDSIEDFITFMEEKGYTLVEESGNNRFVLNKSNTSYSIGYSNFYRRYILINTPIYSAIYKS